jgi:CubicO group peptidase (beta-lactamase class C family)
MNSIAGRDLRLGLTLLVAASLVGVGASFAKTSRKPASTGGFVGEADRIAHDFMRTANAPGMALCVRQHGRTLASRAYGIADLENQVPVTTDSEFALASITKQLTAAAILQLAEKGSLNLDDDISRFLPDFPAGGRGVTIRRLLNHTAGIKNLQDLGDRFWKQSYAPIETRELIDLFKAEPLDFEPGTAFHYTNSGYVLLGAVIESLGGEPYADYIRHHVLDPLGLRRIVYGGTLDLIAHRAHPYWFNGTRFVNAGHFDYSQGFAMGGFYSTAEELALWTEALHHGQVLGPFFYQLMITPGILPDGEALTSGFGMELGTIRGRHVYAHAGGGVGFISQVLYVSEEDLTIAVMTNSNFDGGAIEMADRLMRTRLHIPGAVDLPLPPEIAARDAGRYCLENEVVEIAPEEGHLVAHFSGGESRRLRYQGGDEFAQDGRLSRIVFRDRGGRVEGFSVARYGSQLGRATREE